MVLGHTSSVERFGENFDHKVVTYLIFSLERTDFKNVVFEKIPWAPSEVAEVKKIVLQKCCEYICNFFLQKGIEK